MWWRGIEWQKPTYVAIVTEMWRDWWEKICLWQQSQKCARTGEERQPWLKHGQSPLRHTYYNRSSTPNIQRPRESLQLTRIKMEPENTMLPTFQTQKIRHTMISKHMPSCRQTSLERGEIQSEARQTYGIPATTLAYNNSTHSKKHLLRNTEFQ